MSTKIEIKAPDVATIGIAGPTQCGKSIVMDRLRKVLEREFGATVVLNKPLREEFNGTSHDDLADWEKRMVANTVWVLVE